MANKAEANQIFTYLAKGNEISIDKIHQIHTAIYGNRDQGTVTPPGKGQNEAQVNPLSRPITKTQFESKLGETLKLKNIDEQLLYLFYSLDRDKKGYLTPEDIMAVFKVINKNITMNDIENSFKYVKVYKNKMTFQDFKQYFHNF